MKTYSLICAVLLLTGLFSACRKTASEPVTEAEATQQLVQSKAFIDFATDFIPDMTDLMNYHHKGLSGTARRGFLKQVEQAGTDMNAVNAAYTDYNLNFNNVLLLKNKIDNDLLHVFNKHPFLLQFGEEQIRTILINAIDQGLHSQLPGWNEAKSQITLRLNGTGMPRNLDGTRVNLYSTDLTISEVWDCLKNAAGFGTASILGIAGLKKLAEQGIQQAVISVSSWLAQRAGWIGLIVLAVDFSVCVYNEAHD